MIKKPGLLKRNKGVQPGTINKVAAQVAAAESAETHEYELRHVPLANIHLWDDQPRSFQLSLEDIYRGNIKSDDELVEQKQNELEGIIGLAMSQKAFGILNAPLAYALPGKAVQLMGGQRRTMAAIFAVLHIRTTMGSDDIPKHDIKLSESPDLESLQIEKIAIKVFVKKPDELVLESIGIADNVQRTDLPISDKLRWVVKFATQKEGKGLDIGWRDLVDTLGLSRSQAYEWLKVVNSRTDIWVEKIIEMVIVGKAPFKKLSDLAAAEVSERESLFKSWFEDRPASDRNSRVSLGTTDNLNALRSLVLANVSDQQKAQFEQIDWNKPKEAKKGFTEFLKSWEESHG